MLLSAGPALKPWWSVASSGQANSSCHQPALNPGPNGVYWSLTSLSVGSSDFPAKKNIWLVSDWSPECKQFYLQRGWRVEPCSRAKQGVNQPDSTETPSEIYFHFWPIFSCELISCCHTSCNLCQDSKFLHFWACSEQSGILMAATPVPGVPPCAPCSLNIPQPWQVTLHCTEDRWHPCCCHAQVCQTEGDSFLHGGEVWHLLLLSHQAVNLGEQHTRVQSKSCV